MSDTNNVRLILKKTFSDAHGVSTKDEFVTLDIKNDELEKLLAQIGMDHKAFTLVGSELLDPEGAKERYNLAFEPF